MQGLLQGSGPSFRGNQRSVISIALGLTGSGLTCYMPELRDLYRASQVQDRCLVPGLLGVGFTGLYTQCRVEGLGCRAFGLLARGLSSNLQDTRFR